MDRTWTFDHNCLGNRSRATSELPNKVWAPKVMLDMMVATNDPRLPIVFDRAFDSTRSYKGLPSSPDSQPATVDSAHFSRLNAAMFRRHDNFPGYVMTAAEVAFLKSEAYMRGWATGDPKAAYDDALRLSVDMYYATYNRNSKATPLTLPSAVAVNAFIDGSLVAYNGTLE